MTPEVIIAFAVVLFVGMPSMLKNWTAVGLVASFLTVQVIWWATRQAPLEVLIVCDFIVVTVIFLKGAFLDELPGRGLGKVWAAFAELSRADKIILGLFLPCWATWAIDLTPAQQYWTLWTLGIGQFLIAGAEAFGTWRRGRASVSSKAHPADWFLRPRCAGHGW